MNAIVEAKVGDYLRNRLHYRAYDIGTVVECMRALAGVGGNEVDEPFRFAGLGAGPEARIAAGLVDLALLGGGCETSEYAIRAQVNDWIRRHRRKGAY